MSPRVLSAPAVAALVSRLERQAVTTNQVRYLPLAVPRDARGALQYGPCEVALVRLAVRLARIYRREKWPQWKVRAALLYLVPVIRQDWAEIDERALVVNPKDGMAIIVRENAQIPNGIEDAEIHGGIVVPLRSVVISDEETRAVLAGEVEAA